MLENLIRIAIIDDDPDDFQLLKELLQDIKTVEYEIQWIPNSKKALIALKSQIADIYLMDYRIDEKTGLDILEEVQAQDLPQPIILLTGYDDPAVDLAAMQKGVADYLSKSNLTSEILERSIRYCIKRALDQQTVREAEKAKSKAQAAEEANKIKSQFLANMSHEIRTPLNAILGYAELALEKNTPEKTKDQFISVIRKNGEHLLELINDILDLSKVEAGSLQINNYEFDWRAVLSEVIELLEPRAKQKNISLTLKIDPQLPEKLNTDPHRFRQIILNLLGNSLKFTDEGSIQIICRYGDTLLGSDREFLIQVEDTGVGISAGDQKQLFQPFKQGHTKKNLELGGTGLGLNLSRKLALAMGGDLKLECSQIGKGSTFSWILPAHFSSHPKNLEIPSPSGATKTEGNAKQVSVLLIDDDTESQILLQWLLRGSPFHLEIAQGGIDGLKKTLEKDYDIILTDIQMPEMDGYEVVKTLRARGYKKPVIAFSARAMADETAKAMLCGFSAYLTKPIRKTQLLQTLSKYSFPEPEN